MPQIPTGAGLYSIDDSIAQILTSIAMEEVGLSHIINATGEKLQYVLGTLPGTPPSQITPEELLEADESARETLGAVLLNQMFLLSKMSTALGAYLRSRDHLPAPVDDPAPAELLSAGDTGFDLYEYTALALDIPFGANLYARGDAVAHFENSPELVILKPGRYEIEYRLTVDNPAVAEGTPLDNYVELSSSAGGMLDGLRITAKNQQVCRKVTAQLLAGERVTLRVSQPSPGEMAVRGQAITILRKA